MLKTFYHNTFVLMNPHLKKIQTDKILSNNIAFNYFGVINRISRVQPNL